MPFRNDKVRDVIAVLAIMRNKYRNESSNRTVTKLRIDAVKSVAETKLQSKRFKNFVSAHETINDAFARRLKPDIADRQAFDELAVQWLRNNSMRLKDILLKHSKSNSQLADVNDFFDNKNWPDIAQVIQSDGSLSNQIIIPEEIAEKTELEYSPQAVGAGFGNHDENKEVETAAISFVTNMYKLKGWYVESVENDKCGFDLLCTHGEAIENVEVKGIKGDGINFTITKGELEQAKKNGNFLLYAITQALSSPQHHRFSGPELLEKFDFLPLQYRAVYKKPMNC